jgi:hypothetical protein
MNFFSQLLESDQISFLFLRRFEKSAEFTGGNADIRIVDVPVDDIGNTIFGIFCLSDGICEKAELMQISLFFKQTIVIIADTPAGGYFVNYGFKLHPVPRSSVG